jgi:tripartite-type tricarboxylate transporter receptor subunit TctC
MKALIEANGWRRDAYPAASRIRLKPVRDPFGTASRRPTIYDGEPSKENTMPALRAARDFALLLLLPTLLVAACVAPASAQEYPTKPVRLIIPFPPGGSNDIVGRMIAAQLSERLGKQVVPDNHGGAGGLIGTDLAAKSPPDGYTLLLISVAYAFNTSMYQLPYDPATAFAPVAMLGTGPVVLAVTASLPVSSVKELLALAKAKPGQLYYASAGVGSFQHLASALFKLQSGADIVHVPFKGGGPAMLDVIAGNTQIAIGSLIQMLPQIKTGRLKVLGVGSVKRIAVLPDVPTISEAGVPGYEATNWWGILAPAGTSPAVIARLHRELSVILGSAETKKRFETEGAEALRMEPEEFGRFIAAETVKWARVVKEAGIKPE